MKIQELLEKYEKKRDTLEDRLEDLKGCCMTIQHIVDNPGDLAWFTSETVHTPLRKKLIKELKELD